MRLPIIIDRLLLQQTRMTIFSTKACEKKKAEDDAPSANRVSSDNNVNLEKEDAADHKFVPSSSHFSSIINKRGKRLVKICVASAVFVILICGIILGIVIYSTGLDKVFHGWCDVHYHEYKRESQSSSSSSGNGLNYENSHRFYQRRIDGSFRQEVVIDLDYGIFERIEVPRIGESRKATVIHDFGKNLTAIADQERSRCFILPLSRSMVKPPRDLFDMLNQMKMGFYFYYMPEAEVVRESYTAITPPVQRMAPFGYSIWKECHTCDTFLLTKDVYPQTTQFKRNACELVGTQYCLGDGGTDQMLCIKIKDCL